MALSLPLFPIDQPVPEERQVGRRSSIDALERRLTDVSHQWLIGERRIGKTSVAEAVLTRLREQGAVALSVDLDRILARSRGPLPAPIAETTRLRRCFALATHEETSSLARRAVDARISALACSTLND